MFIRKIAASAALMLAMGVAHASPISINFDDGIGQTAVGAHYAALGVTFSNALFTGNFNLPGSSGPLGIYSATSGYTVMPTAPISAIFSNSIDSFSLSGIDVGTKGFMLTAYDAATGGNVVNTAQVFGSNVGIGEFYTLQVTGTQIFRVDISQAIIDDTGDGILFDNLTFNTATTDVPEPGSLALLGLGLTALAMRRKSAAKTGKV